MNSAVADSISLIFYFFVWWAFLLMANFTVYALGIFTFNLGVDALAAVGLSFVTVLLSKLKGEVTT